MKQPIALVVAFLVLTLNASLSYAAGSKYEGVNTVFEETQENMGAYLDAKISALKVGVKMNSQQEQLWPSLESVIRSVAKDRIDLSKEWHDYMKEHHNKPDLIDALKHQSKWYLACSAELDKLADAAKPLYESLSDAQKHRFSHLLHEILDHHKYHHVDVIRHYEQMDDFDNAERKQL